MKNQQEIEELLNSYIDGELDERHETEVKRLVSNNTEIAELLKNLQACKKLVNSLETCKPPEEIVDEIKSSIERQTLLQPDSISTDHSKGKNQLLIRKLISFAAIIILSVVLGIVLYDIIGPADSGDAPLVANRKPQQKIEFQGGSQTNPTSAVVVKDSEKSNLLKTVNVKLEFISAQPDITASVINNNIGRFSSDTVGPQISGLNKTVSFSMAKDTLAAFLSDINNSLTVKTDFRAELDYNSDTVNISNMGFSEFAEIITSSELSDTVAALKKAETLSRLSNTGFASEIQSAIDFERDFIRIPKPLLTSNIKDTDFEIDDSQEDEVFVTIEIREKN
jgi:hypothetical protein